MDLGEIQELIDTTPEELPEDDWVLLNQCQTVEKMYKRQCQKTKTKNTNVRQKSEGFWLFRLLLPSFMTWMTPSMIWALVWMVMVGGLSLCRNILREMKSEIRQKLWYIPIVTPSVPAPPAAHSTSSPSSVSATPETARPTLLCSLRSMEMARMKTFMMIYFHLMK